MNGKSGCGCQGKMFELHEEIAMRGMSYCVGN
jgi:hypothetical protein